MAKVQMRFKKVICILKGGLGNQMFQYAASYSLAKYCNFSLVLDISSYEKNFRSFELGIFKEFSSKHTYLEKKASVRFFREASFSFDERFFKKYWFQSVCIVGYWQSFRYFRRNKADLLKIFTFDRKLMSDETMMFEKKIRKQESVSLHVRRGDYLETQNKKIHGILGIDYYTKALSCFEDENLFIVFSDDVDYCREVFTGENFLIIDDKEGRSDWEDMYLMSICDHNIIANSSFSWWGAYLNKNPEKKVIAPKNWFSDNSKDTKDLIPESWVRI